MFGHNSRHCLVSPVTCSQEPWLMIMLGRKWREMLYYIWLCSNKCHVVVTSVTSGRDIAMQGHSRGCRTSSTRVMEPGCCSQVSCSQDICAKPSCWSLSPKSHRLLSPLGEPLPAGRGAGHLRKPEKYPGLIHLVFRFQTLTEVFGGPRRKGDKGSSERIGWQQ